MGYLPLMKGVTRCPYRRPAVPASRILYFRPAGFGGVRGLWEFNPFSDWGQLERRCPRSPHPQYKAAGLGASTLGLKGLWVGFVGCERARTATSFSSIAAMRSTSASRGEGVVAAATWVGVSGPWWPALGSMVICWELKWARCSWLAKR